MRSPIEIFQTSLKKSRARFLINQLQLNLHKRESFISTDTEAELYDLLHHLPRTDRQPLIEKFEKLRMQFELWKESQASGTDVQPAQEAVNNYQISEETLLSNFSDSQKEFIKKCIDNYTQTLWSQSTGLFKSSARLITGSGHQGGSHYWDKWQKSDSPKHLKSAIRDFFDLEKGNLHSSLEAELKKFLRLENTTDEIIIARIQKEFFDKKGELNNPEQTDNPVNLWNEYAETLESLQQQLELTSATFHDKLSIRNMENWRGYLEMGLLLWKKRSITPLMQSTQMLQTLGQALGISLPFATAAGVASLLARIPTPITMALAGGGWFLAYRNQTKKKRETAVAGLWLLLYQRSQLLKQRAALELAAENLRKQISGAKKGRIMRGWQKLTRRGSEDIEQRQLAQTLETLEDLLSIQEKLGLL